MEGFNAKGILAVGASLVVVCGSMLGGMHLVLDDRFDGPDEPNTELTETVVDLKFHFAELNVAYSIHSATHYEVPIAYTDMTASDAGQSDF